MTTGSLLPLDVYVASAFCTKPYSSATLGRHDSPEIFRGIMQDSYGFAASNDGIGHRPDLKLCGDCTHLVACQPILPAWWNSFARLHGGSRQCPCAGRARTSFTSAPVRRSSAYGLSSARQSSIVNPRDRALPGNGSLCMSLSRNTLYPLPLRSGSINPVSSWQRMAFAGTPEKRSTSPMFISLSLSYSAGTGALACPAIGFSEAPSISGLTRRRRSALLSTNTDDIAIAPAARIGESKTPSAG